MAHPEEQFANGTRSKTGVVRETALKVYNVAKVHGDTNVRGWNISTEEWP